MKTRRYDGVGKKYNGNYKCDCYFCVGDIIDYRDKKFLAQYEDSVLEYVLTKDEDHESVLATGNESILGVGVGQLLSKA